jgi:hypothetical protein
VGSSDHRAYPFLVEAGQGRKRFSDRGGAVVDAGYQVTVQVDNREWVIV